MSPDPDDAVEAVAGGSVLSVAMATHDGTRWLPELLASLAAQQRLPDELVVCDDASIDGTGDVLDAYAATAPFPVRRVDHDVRRGPVRAFETALGAVEGDVVALADQDDVWLPEKLLVLEEALFVHDAELAFTDAVLVDEHERPTGAHLWGELGFTRRQQDSLVDGAPGPLLRHAVVTGCTALMRRRVVDLALPFPSALDLVAEPALHDRWLSKVAGCTGPVQPVPSALVRYRVHAGQVVGARWDGPVGQVVDQARRGTADVRARAEARRRRLDALEARLAERGVEVEVAVQAQLDDLRNHLEVRAGLGSRPSRLIPVLGEVLTGGYRRFGRGTASAVLDLLRR